MASLIQVSSRYALHYIPNIQFIFSFLPESLIVHFECLHGTLEIKWLFSIKWQTILLMLIHKT